MEIYSGVFQLQKRILNDMYKYNTRSVYEDMILELKDRILELEVQNMTLDGMNNYKSNQIKKLKGRIKDIENLEELISHALNDKRFKIKLAVLSLTIQCIFGLAGLYIAVYRNDVITHALIYALQHYCM